MKIPGIMIAATASGSGKTAVTCALMEALVKKGIGVAACKCGPDYIDPMFHRNVLGIDSENLDLFFCEKSSCALVLHDMRQMPMQPSLKALWDIMTGWALAQRRRAPMMWHERLAFR